MKQYKAVRVGCDGSGSEGASRQSLNPRGRKREPASTGSLLGHQPCSPINKQKCVCTLLNLQLSQSLSVGAKGSSCLFFFLQVLWKTQAWAEELAWVVECLPSVNKTPALILSIK